MLGKDKHLEGNTMLKSVLSMNSIKGDCYLIHGSFNQKRHGLSLHVVSIQILTQKEMRVDDGKYIYSSNIIVIHLFSALVR